MTSLINWMNNNRGKALLSFILIVFVVGAILLAHTRYTQAQQTYQIPHPSASNTCGKATPINSSGIGVGAVSADKEHIGLSDGSFAFDLNRNQNYIGLKCAGTQDFLSCTQLHRSFDCSNAESSLTSYIAYVTDDAEALIYRQNVHLWQSGFFFTVIVGISLSNNTIYNSRRLLQGVYVAQEENNRTNKGFKLRILIANFGDTATSAAQVIEQIIAARNTDPSIKGIINIPLITSPDSTFSSAIQKLASLNVPVIFPTGFAGSSNERYSTMFHIAPATWQEGNDGALYAQNILNRHSTEGTIIFVDRNDIYSRGLACSFMEQLAYHRQIFAACDSQSLTTICDRISVCHYYQQSNIGAADASAVLSSTPQLIYFAGNASDAKSLLGQLNLLPHFKQLPDLHIMGGDALYPGDYLSADYPRMMFTAFAYPDEWQEVHKRLPNLQPLLQAPFFDEYALNFQGWQPESVYGFVRPDSDAILSFDATDTLLQSIGDASGNGMIPNVTLDRVLQALQNVSWQGFSGYIHFDVQGNPVRKTTVFLEVNQNGETQMKGIHGCFLSTYCF